MTEREANSGLTQGSLRALLRYHPRAGKFIWKVTLSFRRGKGQEAGSFTSTGYVRIAIHGIQYKAHHLAWFYMTGQWPEQVDHKNGIKTDNSWHNLRLATNQDNQANKKRHRNNTSGFKGVYWSKQRGKWGAKINPDRRQVYLGFFDDIEDAREAYAQGAKKYFGQFARVA